MIDSDHVAAAVVVFMDGREQWTGTATELLTGLDRQHERPPKHWPTTPQNLGGRLRRAAPALRGIGIGIEFDRDDKHRAINLTRETPKSSSSLSEPSSADSNDNDDNESPVTSADSTLFDDDYFAAMEAMADAGFEFEEFDE